MKVSIGTFIQVMCVLLFFTGCKSQLVDNSIRGSIGELFGSLSLSSASSSISLDEGSQTTVVLVLNKPSKKDIEITWTAQDPHLRLQVANGVFTIPQGQVSSIINLKALKNLVLGDNESIIVTFSSPKVFNPFHLQLDIIDKTKPATLIVVPNPLAFPLTPVNNTNVQSATLQNIGDLPATALSTLGTPSSPFGYDGGTYPGTTSNCGNSLASGGVCTLSFAYLPVIEGVHSSAASLSYNDGANTQSVTLNLNGSSSSVIATLSGAPASNTNSASYSITVGGAGVTQYKYAVGGSTLNCSTATYSSAAPIATPFAGTGLSDGGYTLCVVGFNGTIWQQASLATTYTWTVDTLPPSLPSLLINGVASGYTTSTSSILSPFAVGASEMYITPTAGCASGGSWEAYAITKSHTLTANTVNTVYVKYRDLALNESSCVSASMIHDNQNPNSPTGLTLGSTLLGLSSTPTISWTATSDNGPSGIAKYQVRLLKQSDSSEIATWQDLASGGGLSGLTLTAGTSYVFEVRSVDQAGNMSAATQSSSFTPFSALVASLTGAPSNPSNATTLNVAVGGAGVSSYSYKVGVTASTDCASSAGYLASVSTSINITASLSALVDGSVTLCVVGSDGTNWQAYSSATSYSWVKDTQAPIATITRAVGQDEDGTPPIKFKMILSEPINEATFSASDISQDFVSSTVSWSVNKVSATEYEIVATSGTFGRIKPKVASTLFSDLSGNLNSISQGTESVEYSPFNFSDFSMGTSFMCGISFRGKIYCWGRNEHGQLGQGDITNRILPSLIDTSLIVGQRTFKKIAGGTTHTCAMGVSGETYCWGSGNAGKRGDGTFNTVNRPQLKVDTSAISNFTGFKEMSAGGTITCAVTTDGKGYCWGYNADGELGDGSNTNSYIPKLVNTTGIIGFTGFKKIYAGPNNSSCALSTDGEAYCWGLGTLGQLGNGINANSNIPVKVDRSALTGQSKFKDIAVGNTHACALSIDAQVYCWGQAGQGRLGNGTTTPDRNKPVLVVTSGISNFKGFTQLALGNGHSCALEQSGRVFCWGLGTSSQLGNGANVNSTLPVMVDTSLLANFSGFKSIRSLQHSTCGLSVEGNLFCWGVNTYSQLGDGGTVNQNRPVIVNVSVLAGSLSYADLSLGGGHSCGLSTNGNIDCWGQNNSGQLGLGNNSNIEWPSRVNTSSMVGSRYFSKIFTGAANTCGITGDGLTYCWGEGANGQNGSGLTTSSTVPVQVDTSSIINFPGFSTIAIGSQHICGLSNQGKAYCWGLADERLGIGLTGSGAISIPQEVDTSGIASFPGFNSIMAGLDYACATTITGQIYCWGNGASGKLGNGNSASSSTPQIVDTSGIVTSRNFIKVAGMYETSCATASDGEVFCWGVGDLGQMGNNSNSSSSLPATINTGALSPFPGFKLLTVGNTHACANSEDSRLFCWGSNSDGQIGVGSSLPWFNSPQEITNINSAWFLGYAKTFSGGSHNCSLDLAGHSVCWGKNQNGQLGDGTNSSKNLPSIFQRISF